MWPKRTNGFSVIEIFIVFIVLVVIFVLVVDEFAPKPKPPLPAKVNPVAFGPEIAAPLNSSDGNGQYHSVALFEKIRNLHGGELLEHHTGTMSLVLSCSIAGDCLITDGFNDEDCRYEQSIYGNRDWWMNNFFRVIRPDDSDYPEAIRNFLLQ